MAWQEPEEDDPLELRACLAPADPEGESEMAEAIVDEYARFGHDRPTILRMFRDPFFALTHSIWRARGDAWCADLIDRVAARWRVPSVSPARKEP